MWNETLSYARLRQYFHVVFHSMIISKFQTYGLLMGLFVFACILYQSVWLVSGKTDAQVVTFDRGAGRQYKTIETVKVQYSLEGKQYAATYLRSGTSHLQKTVAIKYLLFAPSWSRLDNVIGNWGLILVLAVLYFFVITIIFLTKEIIPMNATFALKSTPPFLWRCESSTEQQKS